MSIIPQRPFEKPYCPWTGIDGGPQHPAHAVEVAVSDRVGRTLEGWENATDVETLQLIDATKMAAGERPGMELYRSIASLQTPRGDGTYYACCYFRCLVCGFVLPAQEMHRG